MKPLYFTALIIMVANTLVSSSCRKGGKCEGPLNINQSEIVVIFKDKTTGKYLCTEINPLYNKDSLKVFDAFGNRLVILSSLNQIPNTSSRYYDLSFGNIYNQQRDAVSFNSEICKDFIVQYRYNELDTIKTCFKAKKTECGSVFETLKVFHKGQLLTTAYNEAAAHITLLKN